MPKLTNSTEITKAEAARHAMNADLLATAAKFGAPVAFTYSNVDGSKTGIRTVYPKTIVEPVTKGHHGTYIRALEIATDTVKTFTIRAISGTVFVGAAPAK